MTDMEILYNAYRDSGLQTNEEMENLLGWPNGKIRTMKARLKARGLIDYEFGKPVTILKPYREDVEKPESFKAAIYREMLEVYMEDFLVHSLGWDAKVVDAEFKSAGIH